MNSIILVTLFASAFAAPAPGNIAVAGPVLHSAGVFHAAPVVYHAAPAVVQVPLQKTIHYQVNPVVTGYSTSIIKPAIATQTIAHPVVHAPLAVAPIAPHVVAQPAPVAVETPVEAVPAPAPEAAQPADDAVVIASRAAEEPAVVAAPAPVAVAAPAPATIFTGPGFIQHQAFAFAGAPALTYAAAPAPVLIKEEAGPLDGVTKEKVLAPVRTHTQITPQITQIQPEVTVRKVIHNVDVHTPVVAAPALTVAGFHHVL